MGRCLAPEGSDNVFGFRVHPEGINYFLERLVEGFVIQVVLFQVGQGSIRELDETGRDRPGHGHFNVIAFVPDSVQQAEDSLQVGFCDEVSQHHYDAETDMELPRVVKVGLDEIPKTFGMFPGILEPAAKDVAGCPVGDFGDERPDEFEPLFQFHPGLGDDHGLQNGFFVGLLGGQAQPGAPIIAADFACQVSELGSAYTQDIDGARDDRAGKRPE